MSCIPWPKSTASIICFHPWDIVRKNTQELITDVEKIQYFLNCSPCVVISKLKMDGLMLKESGLPKDI